MATDYGQTVTQRALQDGRDAAFKGSFGRGDLVDFWQQTNGRRSTFTGEVTSVDTMALRVRVTTSDGTRIAVVPPARVTWVKRAEREHWQKTAASVQAEAKVAALRDRGEVIKGQISLLQNELLRCVLDDTRRMRQIAKALTVLARRFDANERKIGALTGDVRPPFSEVDEGHESVLTATPMCRDCQRDATYYNGAAFYCAQHDPRQ